MITQDVKFAFRQFWKTPGFTISAVITLALGIGANTAIFSLVDTMLFKSPGYAKPTEVLQLFSQDKKNRNSFRDFSYPTYRDIREQNTVFTDVLAQNFGLIGIGHKGETRRAFVNIVSANYFSVLGIAPMEGRSFLSEEETPGRAAMVAIVSYNYWLKQGRNPGLIGSEIIINGLPFTIVGIAPKGFTGTMQILSPEVWLPLSVYDQIVSSSQAENVNSLGDRAAFQFLIIGRLKPGVSASTADAALKTLAASLETTFPIEQKDQTFMTAPLARLGTSTSPPTSGGFQAVAPLLFGMAIVVLLVACLNLANMLLARGTARRKEVAIRLALGASRARIIRQLLTEGLVLSLVGGAFGLLVGLWSIKLLVASIGSLLPLDIVWSSGPNPLMLGSTFGLCLFGTLCFALGPAIKNSRTAIITDLKGNAADDARVRRGKVLPRNPLVVIEIAFSLALLTAAMLFIRGALKAASPDTGLQTDRSFLLEIDTSLGRYDEKRAQDLYRALRDRLATLPGVESASVAAAVPFGMVSLSKTVRRAGVLSLSDAEPATAADGLAFNANYNSVGADYFKTVGISLLGGRAFTVAEATHPGTPAVAIIDDVLAKKLWPDVNAIGQRIQYASANVPIAKGEEGPGGPAIRRVGKSDIRPDETIEIVGIVPATPQALFDKHPRGAIYVPFARGFQSNVFFVVKFRSLVGGGEVAAADALRQAVREVDPTMPLLSVKTFEHHLNSNLQLWIVRAGATLFSVFGGLALSLAAVGIYGVKAYSVARRTREIGIRMALGARRETVQWMILREGFVMLATGVMLGLALAAVTGKVVGTLLYQVGALDLIAFTCATMILAAAALLACLIPARKASLLDPMEALRS